MTNRFNEKGITLVELLAALALLGVISVLIWNLFFQATNFNERAITKNQLQQEANLIVHTIQQIHTKSTITSITSGTNTNANESLTIYYNNTKPEIFYNQDIKYILDPLTISPNEDYEIELNLTLESRSDPSININIKTTFSKLVGKKQ